MREIAAETTLDSPPGAVFEFLSDLRNHWRLEHRFVEVDGLDDVGADGPTGGLVCVRGPLGLSRLARTRVLGAEAPDRERPGWMSGRADVGRATVGRVEWEIASHGSGSRVRLSARVETASVLDRVLLFAGGAWWLRGILRGALARLDAAVSGG